WALHGLWRALEVFRARIRRGSQPSAHRDHFSEDRGVVPRNRFVRLVLRDQPDMAVLALERFHRGLTVDHRCHDVAVFSGGLLPDHHPVAVGDSGIDHRIARDAEEEYIAFTDDVLGQRIDVFDRFLCQYGFTCGDTADQGYE